MTPRKRPPARARKHVRHQPGAMNKTELSYSFHLDELEASGFIAEWWFEQVKLRVAYDACWITIDFMVQLPDGTIEFHDVKGGPTMEDAAIKQKVIVDKFPFRLFEARYVKRQWVVSEIGKNRVVE